MKNIGTILFYLVLVSIIPLSTVYILFYNDKESEEVVISVKDDMYLFDKFNQYAKDTITVQTRTMLVNKKFDELNKYLEELDKKYPTDISIEDKLFTSYATFKIKDTSYEETFNEWVKLYPNSYSAYLARGVYYHGLGWMSRGHRYASETEDEQFKKMYDYFGKAISDLKKSLELKENTVYAQYILMDIASVTSNENELNYRLKKALETNNNSYKVRRRYLIALSPRWGGSHHKMHLFVTDSNLDIKANPKLKYLSGASTIDEAQMAVISSQYEKADELYKKSLELSEGNPHTYFELGKNSIRRDRYEEGISYINKAIEVSKEDFNYFYWRAIGYIDLKEYEKAKEDLFYAYSLNPFDKYIKKKKKYLAKVLNRDAYDLRKNYETEKALDLYNMALELDLENASIYDGIARASIQKQDLDSALNNVKNAIELEPNNINHYILIDYILAKYKDWDQIISYWDSFIERNPKNARAYVERGGAYYHKGDMNKAVENAKISADLGNLEGKEAYEKFKHLAR